MKLILKEKRLYAESSAVRYEGETGQILTIEATDGIDASSTYYLDVGREDGNAYQMLLTADAEKNLLTGVMTSAVFAESGTYGLQVVSMHDEVIEKSSVCIVKVFTSINATESVPSWTESEYQAYLEQMNKILADTKEASKIALPSGGTAGQVLAKKSDSDYDYSWADASAAGSYKLPIASTETLGGIKIGNGFSMRGDGTLDNDGITDLPIATGGQTGNAGIVRPGKGLEVEDDGTLNVTLEKGEKGSPGADGISPTVSSTGETASGALAGTITGADGKTISVYNGAEGSRGKDGNPGVSGKDGTSVTVVTTQTESGAEITFTDASGAHVISLANGKNGRDGSSGADGKPGVTPDISANASVDNTEGSPAVVVTKTGTDEAPAFSFAFSGLKGSKGESGGAGKDGLSAYEVAVKDGYAGTESEWLASLKGADGATGPAYTLTDADKTSIANEVLASMTNAETEAL